MGIGQVKNRAGSSFPVVEIKLNDTVFLKALFAKVSV